MANLSDKLKVMSGRLSKTASAGSVDVSALREYLGAVSAIARRVEASRAVTGFFGGGLMDIIETALQIATPLASMSGDYELGNLLGSLKVWLDKKKAQEAAEEMQRQQMMSQTYDDLTFNYSF